MTGDPMTECRCDACGHVFNDPDNATARAHLAQHDPPAHVITVEQPTIPDEET